MRMLGYDPPAPKLWKAVLGAAIITFPVLYLADVAILHHRPGWIYVGISCFISFLLGYQMYSSGPDSLRPFSPWFRRSTSISSSAQSLIPKNSPRSEREREIED